MKNLGIFMERLKKDATFMNRKDDGRPLADGPWPKCIRQSAF